ncbi:hypothetical protein, partial [Flavobacterium sp.]|uniref:hypothetical protein n=1 Tax=Flavobacterium sp. TaxID=239 RepID=UPI003B9DA60B
TSREAWVKFNNDRITSQTPLRSALSAPVSISVVFKEVQSSSNVPIGILGNYDLIISELNSILISPTINSGIQLCTATHRPNGSQITYPMVTSISDNELNPESVVDWNSYVTVSNGANSINLFPSNNFLNIYIVDNIVGGETAFSTGPASAGRFHDGIYIERNMLLSGPDFSKNVKRLAHEVCHYLGLIPIFGYCPSYYISDLDQPNLQNLCSCKKR